MYKLTVYKIRQRIEIANGNQYNRGRNNTIQVVVVKWLPAWPNEALTWVRVPVRNGVIHYVVMRWGESPPHTKRIQ